MLVEKAEEYVKRHDPYVYIMVLPQDRRALSFWLHMDYKLLNTIELAKNLEGDEEETQIILWPRTTDNLSPGFT